MKKTVQYIYTGLACVLAVLFVFQYATFRSDGQRKRNDKGYGLLTDYESFVEEDSDSPIGRKAVYCFLLPVIEEGNSELVFYTIHQNVKILVDGDCVYSIKPSEKNLFGKTPGCLWNSVPLFASDAGREIRVELLPAYESSLEFVPDFYLGSRFHIWMNQLEQNAVSFVLSLIAVLVGSCFIAYIIYNRRNSEVDKSLLMLGIFSVLVGIWQFSDTPAIGLLFKDNAALAYLPFYSLMLMTVPFILFFMALQTDQSPLWYIPCAASFLSILAQTALMLSGNADLRETLWMTHLVLALDVAVVIGFVIREVLRCGWNRRLTLNVICMSACFFGLAVDMTVYYLSRGSAMMIFGMFGFLTYIIVLGLVSVSDARKLMAIGMRAKRYERMAYHDQLTGLYNRTAYAEHIEQTDFSPEQIIVVMFDLNDLKKCNDTLGHEIGDRYIAESAELIREAFAEAGECYRMGGDEFCVLAKGISLEQCRLRVQKLKEKISDFNGREKGFRIQIACGFEVYDKRIDYDIRDTARRADRMMYREKFTMKHASGD